MFDIPRLAKKQTIDNELQLSRSRRAIAQYMLHYTFSYCDKEAS